MTERRSNEKIIDKTSKRQSMESKDLARVDHDIVWKTIREYLPLFLKRLQEAVATFEDVP